MTLDELQIKYEGVLLCAPHLAADMADMVQAERADEREMCAAVADDYLYLMVNDYNPNEKAFTDMYHTDDLLTAIRNRNTEESN